MHRTRVIMIGGFLGAGKTTAMLRLAQDLDLAGLRCGVVTNDQSVNLVDTQRARAAGVPVAEVTGGCFCCQFDSLVAAARELADARAIDVLLAEPVGSCTDLMATVAYPLRLLHGKSLAVAPLTVLIDPACCRSLQQGGAPGEFTDKVQYIARKQLEEAELLVLSKVDTATSGEREACVAWLQRTCPRARVMQLSCVTGEGLPAWRDAVLSGLLGQRPVMDVDYDAYAEGEARLGWLNATVELQLSAPGDGNDVTMRLASRMSAGLRSQGAALAHLKLTLTSPECEGIALVSCTHEGQPPRATSATSGAMRTGTMTINVRAEASPEALESLVRGGLEGLGGGVARLTGINAFRPGRPVPTHRLTTAGAPA